MARSAVELRQRRLRASGLFAGGLVVCALLAAFPPGRFSFYPPCPIHAIFGILCPGCGATRALAALLRGHFAEAVHLNALFVLLVLPVALAFAFKSCWRAMRCENFRWPQFPVPALYAMLVAAAAFTIARNLQR